MNRSLQCSGLIFTRPFPVGSKRGKQTPLRISRREIRSARDLADSIRRCQKRHRHYPADPMYKLRVRDPVQNRSSGSGTVNIETLTQRLTAPLPDRGRLRQFCKRPLPATGGDLTPNRIHSRNIKFRSRTQIISETAGMTGNGILTAEMPLQLNPVRMTPGGDLPEKIPGSQFGAAHLIKTSGLPHIAGILHAGKQQRINRFNRKTVAPAEKLRQKRRPRNPVRTDCSGNAGFIGKNAPDRPAELLSRSLPVPFMHQTQKLPRRQRIHQIRLPAGRRKTMRLNTARIVPDKHLRGKFGISPDDFTADGSTGPSAFIIKNHAQPETPALRNGKTEQPEITFSQIRDTHSGKKIPLPELVRHRMQGNRTESGITDLRQLTRDRRFGRIAVPIPENARIPSGL